MSPGFGFLLCMRAKTATAQGWLRTRGRQMCIVPSWLLTPVRAAFLHICPPSAACQPHLLGQQVSSRRGMATGRQKAFKGMPSVGAADWIWRKCRWAARVSLSPSPSLALLVEGSGASGLSDALWSLPASHGQWGNWPLSGEWPGLHFCYLGPHPNCFMLWDHGTLLIVF